MNSTPGLIQRSAQLACRAEQGQPSAQLKPSNVRFSASRSHREFLPEVVDMTAWGPETDEDHPIRDSCSFVSPGRKPAVLLAIFLIRVWISEMGLGVASRLRPDNSPQYIPDFADLA
jgi:hypothetical protein